MEAQNNRYTLFELNEHLRRVVALNFSDLIWITGELAQVSESRGHLFLSLIQKNTSEWPSEEEEEGNIIARSEAVIWSRAHRRLKRKLGAAFGKIMQSGFEVLLQVQVDFHERYGLKLLVQDIDPAFTVGKLEIRRQQTLQILQQQGLLDKNRQLQLPQVLQRIAVISSERAAGLQDFKDQLQNNPYAYHFEWTLFNAAMQGEAVHKEIPEQIEWINDQPGLFDCVVMIRGGGAKLDLLAFDDLDLCKAIANCKLPLITGIGHDIDQTIADLVAYENLKTPTAVAEWIVQHNLSFESEMIGYGTMIRQHAQQMIKEDLLELERLRQEFKINIQHQVKREDRMLEYIERELDRTTKFTLKNEMQKLSHLEALLRLLDPSEVLKRGFTMTLKDGKPVKQASDLEKADIIESVFKDRKITSKVV